MENQVSIKRNDDGSIVTPFNGNPKYGYVVLTSVQIVVQSGWARKKERSTLMKGECDILNVMFASVSTLPGKIVVTECLEDNIPSKFSAQFDKEKSLEENIDPYIKRAGKDGPVLMNSGKRILRFTEYSDDVSIADGRIAHENGDEVKAHAVAQAESKAELPE